MEKKSDRTIIDTCKPLIKHSTKILVRKRKEGRKCNILFVVNTVAFILSIITAAVFWLTDTYNHILLQNIVLTNGSMIKDWYFKPPINKIVKVYVFNYTNVDRFVAGHDKKLHVEEVGPLVYEELIEKINVRYEGFTIAFNENRSHLFSPELSSHGEDAVVIVPNIPLISAIPNVIRLGFFAKIGFGTIVSTTKPREFENLTLADYIHGHTDSFMDAISRFKWDFTPTDIGILAQRRGVSKERITIDAGLRNANDVGRVIKVGGKRRMDVWKSDKCNDIDASDGIFYGPQKVRNMQTLDVYLPEFCRSLPLDFRRKSYALDNIPAYYYEAPANAFAAHDRHYCEPKSVQGNHTDGVLDVSDCIPEKPPVFISHPHFMEGDLKLYEHIDGLRPNRSLHNSFVYVHPRLSVPLYGVSRMQFNLQVSHFRGYYKHLPEGLILPIAWIETTTPKELPKKFKMMVYLSSVFANYIEITVKYGSVLTAAITLCVFITYLTKFVKDA